MIAKKFNKMHFLFTWVLLGVVSSLSYAVLPTFGTYGIATLLIFWGFAFGIGLPSCLALIPLSTKIEERGRAGGTTLFATYIILPLLFILIGDLDISSKSLVLAGWRGIGLGAFLLHIDMSNTDQPKPVSYRSILRRKTFLLYILPWLAFCLVNYFEHPVLEESFGESMTELMFGASLMAGSLFCIIGGWLIDKKGRRLGVISVLVALGLGYALLSLFPLITSVQVLYMIIDGIAFGILSVAFVFVVWGDMVNGERGEKFYALGIAPIPLAVGLSALISPWLKTLEVSSAFYLASFFIFLAVIPIFFAPELLPERITRKRELREYVEKVKTVTGRD
jgi:hypothetical protein